MVNEQYPLFSDFIVYPAQKGKSKDTKDYYQTGWSLMVSTLVRAYGYDYFKYGLRLDGPPIILDVVLDYHKEINRDIRNGEVDISLAEYQMSVHTKVKNIGDQEKMWFNWDNFWKSLEQRGLKSTYENKLFYGKRSNPPNQTGI